MIDTNQLLNIGFALLAHFTNVVHIPPEPVPQGPDDLQHFLVGSPNSPTDLFLIDRSGADFIIRGAIVQRFRSPHSYFESQDRNAIQSKLGKARLTTNEVVQLAVDTVQRLGGAHSPLTNIVPVLQSGGEYHGKPIPFYRVNWPRPEAPLRRLASIEIDARTGEIVCLDLFARGFLDEEAARKITEQVYKPEKPDSARERIAELYNGPPPKTNQVADALVSWLLVCRKLGISPGSQTNLVDVDWERCSIGTNRAGGILTPMCCVRLKNGTGFTSLNGGVIGCIPWDMYWGPQWGVRAMSQAAQEPFNGTITKDWEDLARNFRQLLVENFGFSESDLADVEPVPMYRPPEVGAASVNTRVSVVFGRFPRKGGKLPRQAAYCDASCYAIMVEFDLNSGEIKGFGFVDRKLMILFAKGQTRADDSLPQH